jgi:hypothetical protein
VNLTSPFDISEHNLIITLWLALLTFGPAIVSSLLFHWLLGYSSAKSISITFIILPIIAVINYTLFITINYVNHPVIMD